MKNKNQTNEIKISFDSIKEMTIKDIIKIEDCLKKRK